MESKDDGGFKARPSQAPPFFHPLNECEECEEVRSNTLTLDMVDMVVGLLSSPVPDLEHPSMSFERSVERAGGRCRGSLRRPRGEVDAELLNAGDLGVGVDGLLSMLAGALAPRLPRLLPTGTPHCLSHQQR